MILGALNRCRRALRGRAASGSLAVDGYEIEPSRVVKGGVAAVKFPRARSAGGLGPGRAAGVGVSVSAASTTT